MGLLTVNKLEKIQFDKEKIIQDIKEGLYADLPNWTWFTSPEYDFDLIVMRSKSIRDQKIIPSKSDWSEDKTLTEYKTYQIICGVCVEEHALDYRLPTKDFVGASILYVSSPKEFFRKLRECEK